MKDERKDIKNEYGALMRKYALPPLEEIEKELGCYVNESPVIVSILRHFSELFSDIISHTGFVFQPTHYFEIIESGFYSEKEKENLINNFQKIMSLSHLLFSSFFESEKDRVGIFKKVFFEYTGFVKPFSKSFFSKQSLLWKEYKLGSEINKSSNGYFG